MNFQHTGSLDTKDKPQTSLLSCHEKIRPVPKTQLKLLPQKIINFEHQEAPRHSSSNIETEPTNTNRLYPYRSIQGNPRHKKAIGGSIDIRKYSTNSQDTIAKSQIMQNSLPNSPRLDPHTLMTPTTLSVDTQDNSTKRGIESIDIPKPKIISTNMINQSSLICKLNSQIKENRCQQRRLNSDLTCFDRLNNKKNSHKITPIKVVITKKFEKLS